MKKSILLALGLSFSSPAALAGGSLGGSGLGLQGGSMGGGGLGSPSLQGGSIGGGGLGLQGGTIGGGSGGMQRSVPDDEINSLNVDGGFSGGGPPSIVDFIRAFFPGTSIHQGD